MFRTIIPVSAQRVLRELKANVLDLYATRSYSQEGEDVLLWYILKHRDKGFYVDVGAHHPKRFSNTYLFYRRGWSGINIDATPGSMAIFQELRPRDINLEAAIAKDRREVTLYIFNEPALNSFDPKLAQSRNRGIYRIVREQKMLTRTLADVLVEHLPKNKIIDLLSVDVEGFDLEVLQSNDWHQFRPRHVLVESMRLMLHELESSATYRFLEAQGYVFLAKTLNTIICGEAVEAAR